MNKLGKTPGKVGRTARRRGSGQNTLTGVPWNRIHTLVPGAVFTALIAFLSIKLSDFVGIALMGFEKSPVSSVMVAVIAGVIIRNTVNLPEWLSPGIRFSVSKILRQGIICLGIRLSIPQVLQLGFLGLPIILVCILAALLFTGFLLAALNFLHASAHS